MSNIKDLFSKKLHVSKVETSKAEVESKDFIVEKTKEREQFVPPIDFTTASNYIRFGSAKEYYANSIERVYNTYPYDGSEKEKIQYRNDSTELDKWLFDNKYPKASGNAVFDGSTFITINRGYKGATTPETTKLAKLFNTKVVKHDTVERRKQTFALDLDDGFTVEWWMKKASFTASAIEGIFSLSSSKGYIDIFGHGTTAQPLQMHASGSDNSFTGHNLVGTSGVTTATIADSSWHHYAISLYRESSVLKTNLYIDGVSKSIQTVTDIGEITDSPTGRLGIGLDVGDTGLRASVDDFRFWNKKQTSEAIYNNYYRAIGGGANSDDFRTELSVYYKFNEGTTGTDATDRIVLDYSGRIANGYWESYSSACRATGSAYTTDGDPIIRSTNSLVTALEAEMELSGTSYDVNNSMSMYDLVPQWMQDDDNGELKKITQIMATYFDDLYAKIEYLPKLKDKKYFQDTEKPLPFAKRLLEERGLFVPDILVERGVLEYFGQRDVNKVEFEKDIEEIKNKIYHNIYNNIEHIYKSKGTEKAYRNMLRCFGIDDEVVKLNLYTDNGVQYLVDKTKHTSEMTKHIDFDETDNFSATVYQENYISGSGTSKLERHNAITAEAEVLVPRKPRPSDSWYYTTPFQSSSVFGIDAADTAGTAYDSTLVGSNLQAYLVKDQINSDRAKWVLEHNTIVSSVVAQSSSALIINETGEHYSSNINLAHTGSALGLTMWVKFNNSATSNQKFVSLVSGSNRISLDFNNNLGAEQLMLRKGPTGASAFSSFHKMRRISGISIDEWTLVGFNVVDLSDPEADNDFELHYVNSSGYSAGALTGKTLAGTMDCTGIQSIEFGDIVNSSTPMTGAIDEVVLWSKALTQTDMEDIYNSGLQQDLTARPDYSFVKYWLRLGGDLTAEVGSPSATADSGTPTYEQHDTLPYEYTLFSHTPTKTVLLESPFYENIYDNQRWNIAARVAPKGYPFAGSYLTSSDPSYDVEFYGVTHNMDEVLHEFDLSTTFNYATGSGLLAANKKLYVGARRTTWTGTVEAKSDLKIAAVSVYYDRLDNKSIKQHNLDPSNYGHNRVHSNPTPFIKDLLNTHVPAQHSLALHWDFQTVTSSDSSGEFVVEDFSSASSDSRYGWISDVVTNEYKGKGYGFPTSSASVVRNEFIFASKKELPEISFTSDSITIIGDEEKFLYEDDDVNDNVFAFEKSMYQSVSEEMLNLFSTIVEYSNLMSKPVDRYRTEYKRLAYARQLFFEKVDGNMDLDRFTDYFKWIDSSISVFLEQLHPANAKFNKGIADMIESHILERPKYQHIYPFTEKQTEIKIGQTKGPGERLYNWKFGHAPDYKQVDFNTKAINIENGSKLEHSDATVYTTTNTLAFWFNPADTTAKNLISFGSGYKIIFDGSNNLTVLKDSVISSTPIPIAAVGSTTFVAITLNGAVVQYSVNGATFNSMTFSSGGTPSLSGKFIIGDGSTNDKFDEMAIFSKVLNNTEIAELYNSNVAMDVVANHSAKADLKSYYRFGDAPGDPEIRPFQGYYIQDTKGSYHLRVAGTWSSYVTPLATSFKVASSSENIHCLWHREREERVVNSTRDLVQRALTTEALIVPLVLHDDTGTVYDGSTYASRRFSKPYKFKGEEQRVIHGGINYAPSKNRDFLKTATKVHGELATGGAAVPIEVVTVGAGLAQGIVDPTACDEERHPAKKTKFASNAVLGKFSNYDGDGPVTTAGLVSSSAEYAYSIKGERILPMNIVEATSSTGYNEVVHYNFREGAMITNLHSDTTSPTNEIPMQSPFTDTWVGGRQSRHILLNQGSDGETSRPEEWRLLIGEHEVDDTVDGAIGFAGPDYGGVTYPNPSRQWAIHFRDGRAKRPVNVANHKSTDFRQGNYSHNYEVLQSVGRLENNKEIRQDLFEPLSHDFGLPSTTNETTFIGISTSANGNVQGATSNRYSSQFKAKLSTDQIAPGDTTPSRKSIFASKFSAPGGFDTMSEAYLDAYGREYSVNNSLNFRNYSVIGKADAGGAGNSGEATTTIETTTVRQSRAIKGSSAGSVLKGFLQTTTLSGMPNTGAFSVSFWFKLTDDTPSSPHGRYLLYDNTRAGIHAGVFFIGSNLRFEITTNATSYETRWNVNLTSYLSWTHVAISWDGNMNNAAVLYVNGSSVSHDSLVTSPHTRQAIVNMQFFDRPDVNSLYELRGSLQDFVFWQRELGSGDVTDIYNLGNYKDYSTLTFASDILIWYLFGEETAHASKAVGDSLGLSGASIVAHVVKVGITNTTLTTDENNVMHIEDGAYTLTENTTEAIETIRVDSHSQRREGLNHLHTRHCGQFGVDSKHGTISAAHYDIEPSFHKIHRNTLVVPTDGSTREIHNNFYVQSPIPASDYNYSWVTSSLGSNYSVSSGTQKVYGYWPKDGILSSSSGFDSAIVFPTASEIFGS